MPDMDEKFAVMTISRQLILDTYSDDVVNYAEIKEKIENMSEKDMVVIVHELQEFVYTSKLDTDVQDIFEGVMLKHCKSVWSTKASKRTLIKAGTKVSMKHIWSYDVTNKKMTEPKDIKITTDTDCTLMEAVCSVEDAALKYVKSCGAGDIRHYFIENIIFTEGAIDIQWGT